MNDYFPSDTSDSDWTPSQATTISDYNSDQEFFECDPPISHEKWKVLSEYDSYLISDMGRVKDNRYLNDIEIKKDKGGYEYCILTNNHGKNVRVYIHTLVANAFRRETKKNGYNQIDHINRLRNDNRAENLRYVDSKTNCNNRSNSKNRIQCYEDLLG